MSDKIKTFSTGGLGDAFIVGLKLNHIKLNEEYPDINHLFVESSEKTLDLIKEYTENCFEMPGISFDFECDPDYMESHKKGKWKDRRVLNTTWHGDYRFPGPDGIKLDDFDSYTPNGLKQKYDVCIQVSAGAKGNRLWMFDPRMLRDLLESKGYKTALVGTNPKYKEPEMYANNFVCRADLKGSTDVVRKSGIYVGLSGYHTYHSLARGIKNVHLEESPEHNRHYIHPRWEAFRYGIRIGTLGQVIEGLRLWGIEV